MKKGSIGTKIEIAEKIARFNGHCRKHGLSITPQRIAVYEELSTSQRHPSATEIYMKVRRRFPNISLATVNNTLITLTRIGLARIVEASGDPKRFDPDLEPHHHFQCVRCRRIVDFQDSTYDNIAVPVAIGKRHLVLGKRVCLEGLCDRCRIKAGKSR